MQTDTSTKTATTQPLDKLVGTRGTIALGYGVSLLFILAFFVWGGSVPLTSAAIASGVVGVEGQKKQVQHLGGGIIKDIQARDGDVVKKGQVLVVLNDIEARSRFNELNNRYILTSAQFARWTAEQNSSDTINTPVWLTENVDQPAVKAAMARQSDILEARAAVLEQTNLNLVLKLRESEEVADAAKARIANLQRKRRLINKELEEFGRLRENGLATRSQLFDLEKQVTNLDLEMADSKSEESLSRQKVAQFNAQIKELNSSRIQESAEQAAASLEALESLRQQVASVKNTVNRSNIRAPIGGYVINSVVNTVGGVVRSGETIMEILPTDEKLLINGQVPPKDRDSVRVGQRAEVTFSAFNRRSTLPVEGKVRLISADSLIDPVTSLPYYKTTIEIDGDATNQLNGETIFPGMQADILIVTGTQTFVQYLLSPITRSFNKAFRES